MTESLCEAVRVKTRYETKDADGETRRERNTRFGQPSPELDIPDDGLYIWNWFYQLLDASGQRVVNGNPVSLSHTDIKSWRENTAVIVTVWEVDTLIKMSVIWSDALADEIEHNQNILAERNKENAGHR